MPSKRNIEWIKINAGNYHGFVGDVRVFRLYRNADRFELDVGLPNPVPNAFGRLVEYDASSKKLANIAEVIYNAWLKRLKGQRVQKS